MQFILNTSFDPHFCALFDEKDQLVAFHFWENRRKDAFEIWSFLKIYDHSNLDFIGGVTGPGGFSSLRAGGVILNALAFSKNLLVHGIRADIIIEAFLIQQGKDCDFLLNSFGKFVFCRKGNGKLERVETEKAVEKFEQEVLFLGLLPLEKQAAFKQKQEVSLNGIEKVCLEVLQKAEPQKSFLPDYEFPAVGG
ncbi:hypothetical protein KAI58_04425 [Candidatus Gracilibacteria bacterium]|nr:hypothetical protein [Candidatus Gracilibacteria bacterium]